MPADQRQHITLYVPSLMGGGAERAAAVLASGFHASGHAVRLLVDVAEDGRNREFVDPAIAVRRLGAAHAGSVWALARELRNDRVDVALAFGGAANLKLVAAQALARSRVPLVLSFHGRSDVGRGRLGAAAFRLAPILTRRAARTVCVSDALVRHLVADWGALAARTGCIPNAVPVERARPARDTAELRARRPAIVAVGRLVPEKDFATLVRALSLLPREVTLTILGEGPERGALEALAAALGVGDRLTLPGYASEPWDGYAKARVFALSSTSEGFGNVVAEALASGLPVVATDCGGPREILGDGQWGVLVPVGDPAAMAAALASALAAPGDPAPRLARAARYRPERIVEDYLALFRSLQPEGGL